MVQRILVDTNILLDYLLCREPYTSAAEKIVLACKSGKITGCIAAHSVSNIFFILRKNFTIQERRSLLESLCELFEVECIDKAKIMNAIADESFSDFEDCLQKECAEAFKADYIVTRNCADFKSSRIPCIGPEELCKLI